MNEAHWKNSEASAPLRGYSVAIAAAAILSLTGIVISHLSTTYHLPPVLLAFWRNTFVASALLPLLLLHRTALAISGDDKKLLLVQGAVLTLFNTAWTTSVVLSGAAVATVLVYCSAAYTVVLDRIFFKERIREGMKAAVLCCLAGCVLVSGAADAALWKTEPLGVVTGLVSGMLYAAYSMLSRTAAARGINPWTTLFYAFGSAAVWLFLLNAGLSSGITGNTAFGSSGARAAADTFFPTLASGDIMQLGSRWQGWAALVFLAVGPTLIGFGLINVALCRLPTGTVNIILTMEPALTAVIACLLLGESLSGGQWWGAGLILSGVVFLQQQPPRRPDSGKNADYWEFIRNYK